MTRHSKSAASAPILTAAERANKAPHLGTAITRVGSVSKLPFGYCALSNNPTCNDAVATKSGRIYSREAILSYILEQKIQIRQKKEQHQVQAHQKAALQLESEKKQKDSEEDKFRAQQLNSLIQAPPLLRGGENLKRFSSDSTSNEHVYTADSKRRRLIDDSTDEERIRALKKVSPWIASSTPDQASNITSENSNMSSTALIVSSSVSHPSTDMEKEERPLSPFSKQPLRVKDLIPINLQRESSEQGPHEGDMSARTTSTAEVVRYICCVSKKPIISQNAIALIPTGAVMLESVAQQLVYPDQLCPVTNKPFHRTKDVLTLLPGSTGFALSGNVESKKYRPNMI